MENLPPHPPAPSRAGPAPGAAGAHEAPEAPEALDPLDTLAHTFAPVTLRRPLSLFHGALGLQVGQPGRPDPDLLVLLVTGRGHLDHVRRAAGPQFKNLENFVRGAHVPTPTTRRRLLQHLGTSEQTLRALAHGRRDGPLLPELIGVFTCLESFFVQGYRAATLGKLACLHCGADMLDDAEHWWRQQSLRLDGDAVAFIERLLHALVGGVWLFERIGLTLKRDHLSARQLAALAAPERHPAGHWMTLVRQQRGLQHDWQLTVGIDAQASGPAPDGRLRKWRCGQELLPMDKALAMIAGVRERDSLDHALVAARTLSLATDLVQACADTPARARRHDAQAIVGARVAALQLHLRLARGGTMRAVPPP